MLGLLKETTEMEYFKKEYKRQAEQNFKPEKTTNIEVAAEELVLEDCES